MHIQRSLVVCALVWELVGSPFVGTAGGQNKAQIELGTELVELRAVVVDKDGRLVTGLSKEDFEVLDGGSQQEIAYFSHEQIVTSASQSSEASTTVVAPGAKTVPTPAVRTVVLFFDDLHMTAFSWARAKDALKQFVTNNLSESDQIGLFAASGCVRMFGQFGADRSVLLDAIDTIPLAAPTGWPENFTPYLAGLIRVDPRDENPPLQLGATFLELKDGIDTKSLDPPLAAELDRIYRATARQLASRVLTEAGLRRRASLSTLRLVCDQLAALPGQRIVFDYTDGFSLKNTDGLATGDDLRSIKSKAARAGVIVNVVIAEGLTVKTGVSPDISREVRYDLYRGDARDIENGAAAIARATGGELIADTNDLVTRAVKILERNDTYYVIDYYTPDPGGHSPREIAVRVKGRPEYSVRTQAGYVPSDGRPSLGIQPTDLRAKLIYSLVRPDAPADAFVTVDVAGLEPIKNRTAIGLVAQLGGGGLELHDAGGRFAFALEIAVVVFDLKGNIAFAKNDSVAGMLSPEDADIARENGIRYSARIDPLAPGIYQARVAFQDSKSGRTGARSVWVRVPERK